MKKLFVVAASIILVTFSCKTTNKSASIASPAILDTLTDLSAKKIIKDKELFASVTEMVPVDSLFTVKDTLHIMTKKIRGCETENFMLLWNGAMAKSLPPQVAIKVLQRVDPACNEQHYFHLTYNIAPLKLKSDSLITNTDGIPRQTTVLRIAGWKNGLRYDY